MKKAFPIILIVMLVILMVSLTGCNMITGFLNDMSSKIEDTDTGDKTGDDSGDSGSGSGESGKPDYSNHGDFSGTTYYFYLNVPEVNVVEGFSFTVEFTRSTQPDLGYFPADSYTHHIPQGWIIEDETIAKFDWDEDDYRCVITGLKEGETTIHATLDKSGKDKVRTDDYKITVTKRVPTKLEISKNKTIYMQHDSFNSNFTLTATFNNNDELKQVVTPTSVDTSAVDFDTKGTYPVTVTYTWNGESKQITYNIQVVDASSAHYDADYLTYTYADYYDHLYADNLQTAFTPTKGTVNYIVIPVWFNDSSKWISNRTELRTKLNTAFFGDKDTTNGKNSVKSYYEELSSGALTIVGTVSNFYEINKSAMMYGSEALSTRSLCKEAVEWFFESNPSLNKKDYDSDHNGTLDAIAVVYCAPDKMQYNYLADPAYSTFEKSTLWSMVMRGGMSSNDANVENPNLEVCMWATAYDVLQDYNGEPIESKTYLHETGHMFGLLDYYDTHDTYSPCGSRIMMDSNRGSQDPYSALALGWAKAIVPQTSATIELKDFQSSREMIILHPEAEQCNSPFDEYIIIELYTPNGLNQFDAQASPAYEPTNVGIRIWHIDARLALQTGNSAFNYSTLYTEPTGDYHYVHRFDNTRGDETYPLSDEHDDYYLIYYVRNMNTGSKGYSMKKDETDYIIRNETMFYEGDSFTLEDYASQFANGSQGKLNSGLSLGWSIFIEDISETSTGVWTATIQVVKTA